MSPPVLVRDLLPTERSLVLSDWKRDIASSSHTWKRSLTSEEFWSVLDNVVEKITFPSCMVSVACHDHTPDTPMGWAAHRDGEILHLHCRRRLLYSDAELAAWLHRHLEAAIGGVVVTYNPLLELRRIT